MVESSKILTVSYGTFSCTLEGFDDSFSTMKAIAEYFRDLAAGDRYFGAEPPTPDAEMLTRIAEREISRRVEVRSSTTGIVLRASDPVPLAAMPQVADAAPTAPAPTQAETPQASDRTAPQVRDLLKPANAAAVADADLSDDADDDTPACDDDTNAALEPAPVMPPAPRPPVNRPAMARAADRARATADDADLADEHPAPQPVRAETRAAADEMPARTVVPAHPDADSVAAKLQRIRAVVGGVPLTSSTTYAEDLDVSGDATNDMMDMARQADAEPATAQPAPVQSREALAESQDQTGLAHLAAGSGTVHLSDAETDRAIARALAVFGGHDTPEADTDDSPWQDAAQSDDATAETTDATTEVPSVEEDAFVPTPSAQSVATPDAAPMSAEASAPATTDATDETDDQISAVLRNLERAGLRQPQREQATSDRAIAAALSDPDSEAAAPTTSEAPTADPAPVVRPAAPRGRILRVTRRPRDPDLQTPLPALTVTETDDTATPAPVATTVTPVDDAMPDGDAPAIRDLTTDREDDNFVDSVATRDGAGDLMDFDPDAVESTLSDDDEADLQRELAALVAEQDAAPAPRPVPAEPVLVTVGPDRKALAADDVPKARRDPLPDTSEAEMSRIMSQADDELADPNASRRRNAIAHLKAAVAATEAARQLGEAGTDRTATEEVFRDDLQKVVQPRRAARPEAAPERSERQRPGPLKLVASQRIDLGDVTPAESVQPRRVATPVVAVTETEVGNFAEFAEHMGATSLQDLLEAAAAYTAYVEGSEDFSRPHIMQKVKQTVAEDFSREDGLRSFGTLLRQGRIERVRNGRFAVSDRTRFKPDAMVAGG